MRIGLIVALVVGAIVVGANPASADTFAATDRGWYEDAGNHDAVNKNTITGRNGAGSEYYHSFFVFDLATLSGTATSATLRLELEAYFGDDALQEYVVYDFGGSIADLTANWGAGSATGLATYADLGGGGVYGGGSATAADVGTVLNIVLSAAALGDINAAAGGSFAVGLRVLSPDDYPNRIDEALRFSSSSEARTHQLVIDTQAVPEPGSIALLGLGAAGLLARRRRKKTAPVG